MTCDECGYVLPNGETECPRCKKKDRKRIELSAEPASRDLEWTVRSLAARVPPPAKVSDHAKLADGPKERIRPMHGILFFLLVGIPSIIVLCWVLMHPHG
jgi:uncharacterized Zn finger protein (UPF0148 family)